MSEKLLDLSGRDARLRVKLPDGEVYALTDPDELGVGEYHRLLADYRKAQRLMAIDEPEPADLEEVCALLVDVCCQILPDAPRAAVARLSIPKMERLVQGFSGASTSPPGRADEATSTSASSSRG